MLSREITEFYRHTRVYVSDFTRALFLACCVCLSMKPLFFLRCFLLCFQKWRFYRVLCTRGVLMKKIASPTE